MNRGPLTSTGYREDDELSLSFKTLHGPQEGLKQGASHHRPQSTQHDHNITKIVHGRSHSVCLHLHQGVWLTALELQDAYWHIPIHSCFQKFLAFQTGHETYQFQVMPFCLGIAPRVYTKLAKEMVSVDISHGVDWLSICESESSSQEDVR